MHHTSCAGNEYYWPSSEQTGNEFCTGPHQNKLPSLEQVATCYDEGQYNIHFLYTHLSVKHAIILNVLNACVTYIVLMIPSLLAIELADFICTVMSWLYGKLASYPVPRPAFRRCLVPLYRTKQRRKAGLGTGYEANGKLLI